MDLSWCCGVAWPHMPCVHPLATTPFPQTNHAPPQNTNLPARPSSPLCACQHLYRGEHLNRGRPHHRRCRQHRQAAGHRRRVRGCAMHVRLAGCVRPNRLPAGPERVAARPRRQPDDGPQRRRGHLPNQHRRPDGAAGLQRHFDGNRRGGGHEQRVHVADGEARVCVGCAPLGSGRGRVRLVLPLACPPSSGRKTRLGSACCKQSVAVPRERKRQGLASTPPPLTAPLRPCPSPCFGQISPAAPACGTAVVLPGQPVVTIAQASPDNVRARSKPHICAAKKVGCVPLAWPASRGTGRARKGTHSGS
jgi:hypothetical protein